MNVRKIKTKIKNYKKALRAAQTTQKRISKMIAQFPQDQKPHNTCLFELYCSEVIVDLITKINFYERVLNER